VAVIRLLAPVFLLSASLAAAPGWRPPTGLPTGRAAEARYLARWPSAGPAERLLLREELDRIERERGFVEARGVLVEIDGRLHSLSEVFRGILERALETPTRSDTEHELGLRPIHESALTALKELRRVHALPAPVGTPTLNLLLGYAQRTLDAWRLSPRARLWILKEVLLSVRELEGRTSPNPRTRWILNNGILPALVGLARRFEHDPSTREAISQVAALLTMPSVLDAPAIAQLASLTRGGDARKVLMRAYRRGRIGDMGVAALVRSVVAQGRDDDEYISGAAPVLLEFLADARVSAALRGELVDLILRRYAPVEPLRPIAEDLLAAAYGQPPSSLGEWRQRRKADSGPIERPATGEVFRFLQVLLKAKPGEPLSPVGVVRADVPLNRPIHDARNRFSGMLVPAPGGEHADFLGPRPGVPGVGHNQLVRRTLRGERISIQYFGAGEEIELCVALPRDGTEPVPANGARMQHVLDLIRLRLERTTDVAESRVLLDLLVRIDTPASRGMAMTFAGGVEHAPSLLKLLEGGDVSAAAPLAERLAHLSGPERERALAAILARGGAPLRERIRQLAKTAPVGLAAPAADALLQAGDADGVLSLLQHKDRYARLCGAALALRLTSHAGALRIVPHKKVDPALLAKLAREAFPKSMGGAWRELGLWLPRAVLEPAKVRTDRTSYDMLFVAKGHEKVNPARFADIWTTAVRNGKASRRWPSLVSYVLTPRNPGRGMKRPARDALLDALEKQATKGPLTGNPLRRSWIDSLTVLAAVQSGLEFDTELLTMADARLRRIAGNSTPTTAARRPGIAWPIWAAADAAGGG